jgi:hypothetical protein
MDAVAHERHLLEIFPFWVGSAFPDADALIAFKRCGYSVIPADAAEKEMDHPKAIPGGAALELEGLCDEKALLVSGYLPYVSRQRLR